MATRLYFSDTLAAPITGFNGSSNWANPGFLATATRLLARTKLGEALADRANTETVAAATNAAIRMHISQQVAAQSISGTFSCVIRGLEGAAATADNALQVIIRVMSADGSTVRGTLYAGQAAALNATVGALGQEFATTAATRIIPAGTALTTVAAQNGDRISVETGFRSYDTSASSDSATLRYGHPTATADFALTAALTTDLVPWVELSGNIVWLDPAPAKARVISHALQRSSTR